MTKSRFPKPLSGRPLPEELMKPLPPVPRKVIQALAFGQTDEIRATARKLAKDVMTREWQGRLLLLYGHYEIDPGEAFAPYQLIDALLKDFIIGFNHASTVGPHRSGRPKGSHKLNRLELYLEVQKLIASGKLDVLEACTKLSRAPRTSLYGMSAAALDKHYRRFRAELKDYVEGRGPDPAQSDMSELARRKAKSK